MTTLDAAVYRSTQTLEAVTQRGVLTLDGVTQRGTRALAAVTTSLEASVGGFSMADHGTPIGRYDMRDDVLADGASVSAFSELLGTGPAMAAPAASNEAVYVAATGGLDFDGSDRYSSSDAAFNVLTSSGGTIAACAEVPSSGLRCIFGSQPSGSAVSVVLAFVSNVLRAYVFVGSQAYRLDSPALTAGTMVRPIFHWDGSTAALWIDGVRVVGPTAITGSLTATPPGSEYSIGSANASWGYLGEIRRVLVWGSKVADASIPAIDTELAA
jgi:hypothetical protein